MQWRGDNCVSVLFPPYKFQTQAQTVGAAEKDKPAESAAAAESSREVIVKIIGLRALDTAELATDSGGCRGRRSRTAGIVSIYVATCRTPVQAGREFAHKTEHMACKVSLDGELDNSKAEVEVDVV